MRAGNWVIVAVVGAVFAGSTFLPAGQAGLSADGGFMVREKVGQPSAKVSLDVKDASVRDVIGYIAEKSGRNIIIDEDISDKVTLRLVHVPWRRALDLVVQQFRGVIEENGPDIIHITKPEMVSFEFKDAPLRNVITIIAKMVEASVVTGPQVNGTVNAQFYEVPWTSALNYVVKTNGFIILKDNDIMQVVDPQTLETQLVTRVFQLRYLQPPDFYRGKIETEFAEKAGGGPVTGVAGEGTILGAATPASGRSAARRAAGGGGSASSFKLLEALRRVASTKGRIDYVDTANAIIVTDTEPNVKAIAELLETIDIEPLQVFIDVRFITTDITNRFRFGVDWANGINVSNTMGSMMTRMPFNLGGGGFEDRLSVTGGGPSDADVAAGIGDAADRTGPFKFGLMDFSQTTQVMEFFASDEGSEIQQSPKLLVLDNHVATIFVGDTVRFAETDSASNQSGGVEVGIREASNSPVQTGFQLWVQPHIIPSEDKIILTLIPEAEVLSGKGQTIEGFDDFTNGLATIQLPRVRSSTVVTKLIMRDGQTAVLGGLINETESQVERKVPLLGDLPGIGWAFKWKSDFKVKNNLLIFVSAHIVRNSSDQREIYTHFGKKYGGKTFRRLHKMDMRNWNERKHRRYETETAPEAPTSVAPVGDEDI